jgi:hypothetical protein
MKTPIVIACLLFAGTCFAQSSFEGTIKWAIKMEITDPAAKARMAEAEKKMNDPATQAKMKEMEKQMNDPQFKAMMDSNPQMKAQMEKTLKMMQGGSGMNSIMPTAFTVRIKGNNSIAQMEGGMMGGMEVLNLTEKKQSYSIDRGNKTYSVLPQGGTEASKTNPDVKITKTNETIKILNHTCTKTIVEITQNGKTMKNFYWTTTELKDLDMKSFAKQHVGRSQSMFYEGVEGVPLKMEVTMPEGSMIMEVTEIKKESLRSSLFELPADFKEVKGYTGKY